MNSGRRIPAGKRQPTHPCKLHRTTGLPGCRMNYFLRGANSPWAPRYPHLQYLPWTQGFPRQQQTPVESSLGRGFWPAQQDSRSAVYPGLAVRTELRWLPWVRRQPVARGVRCEEAISVWAPEADLEAAPFLRAQYLTLKILRTLFQDLSRPSCVLPCPAELWAGAGTTAKAEAGCQSPRFFFLRPTHLLG